MKKILFVFFGVVLFSSSSLFYMADVYTKDEIDDLVYAIYSDYEFNNRSGYLKNISLGDLLIKNYSVKQWSRHEKWLSKIKTNPTYFYKIIENYGEYGLKSINKKLENNSLSSIKFWKSHEIHFARYMKLIDLLLTLDENELYNLITASEYMFSQYSYGKEKSQKVYDFLNEHNIMYCEQTKATTSFNKNEFPHDILSLTKRVCKEANWNEKKFLNQVKIMGEDISQTAKKLGYFSYSFPIPVWHREYFDNGNISYEKRMCNCCKDVIMTRNTYYRNGSIKSHWSCEKNCETKDSKNCKQKYCWDENGKRTKCELFYWETEKERN